MGAMVTLMDNWIEEGIFIDTYRTFNPNGKSYTYRVREAETKKVILQIRLDYGLSSWRFNLISLASALGSKM